MYASPTSTYLSPSASGSKSKLVVAVMSLLVTGTGSAYPITAADSWWKSVKPRVSFTLAKEDPHKHIDVRSPVAHIENIRETLNPSMADLSAVFGVSRQAIYKWISRDSEPEPATQAKLATLSRIADELKSAQVERVGNLVKMKAFNGSSLLDLVRLGTNSSEHISVLITEARKMETNYAKSGLPQSKAKPSDSWQTYVSIPGAVERV
ncbi:helix-turn-helix transcriptional regulator [Pseudomonas baltica]|uniref:helix-turn-helix domain-containing protein n=1 Tax=Pseudomonas baltica TaxID=2762576 RepID=UPI00289CA74A|nr:helix-turn-helix transcriptional regulator [Pseudomonas baltica]